LNKDKVQWTLDLIENLKAAQIGDELRLETIKNTLKNGKIVYDSDKKYLQEKFTVLQRINESQTQTESHKSDEKRLYMISKLQEAEIGNPIRLETMKETLLENKSISTEDDQYLDEKYNQLKKVDESEAKIQQKLEMIEKLKHAEIGSFSKLDDCKSALNDGRELSTEDDSYLRTKIEQYKKINTEPKPVKPIVSSETMKKIVKKRVKPVDPDAKYCAYCQRFIRPERDFSVAALVILLFLGIIPGIIYYFLKSPVCPICKHNQWQIPPDDENP
jgi:hypothetical protein